MMTTTEGPESSSDAFAEEVFAGTGVAAGRLRLQVARIAPHYRIALVMGERGVSFGALKYYQLFKHPED